MRARGESALRRRFVSLECAVFGPTGTLLSYVADLGGRQLRSLQNGVAIHKVLQCVDCSYLIWTNFSKSVTIYVPLYNQFEAIMPMANRTFSLGATLSQSGVYNEVLVATLGMFLKAIRKRDVSWEGVQLR